MYDVYGVGNALVDSEYLVTEAILAESTFPKSGMSLVDEASRAALLDLIEQRHGIQRKALASGGSAANTIATVSGLGGKAFYSCKVAGDATGAFFLRDLSTQGIGCNYDETDCPEGVTGECISMITPDGERTLVTHLGITQNYSPSEIKAAALTQSKYLYIEGYLVSSETGFEAALAAQAIAKSAGVPIALTLSDIGMVQGFRDQFERLFDVGVDLIFANEDEAMAWTKTATRDEAASRLASSSSAFAITLGGEGALVSEGQREPKLIPARDLSPIDTTGAGDTFAGGVLYYLTSGCDLAEATARSHPLAAAVVSQYGARLSHDALQTLSAK